MPISYEAKIGYETNKSPTSKSETQLHSSFLLILNTNLAWASLSLSELNAFILSRMVVSSISHPGTLLKHCMYVQIDQQRSIKPSLVITIYFCAVLHSVGVVHIIQTALLAARCVVTLCEFGVVLEMYTYLGRNYIIILPNSRCVYVCSYIKVNSSQQHPSYYIYTAKVYAICCGCDKESTEPISPIKAYIYIYI